VDDAQRGRPVLRAREGLLDARFEHVAFSMTSRISGTERNDGLSFRFCQ
jgi:hypothetical protein